MQTAAAVPLPGAGGPRKLACFPDGRGSTGSARPKELAQIGAAIGREFSHALLAAVMRKPRGRTSARNSTV